MTDLNKHTYDVKMVLISPDGKWIITVSYDGKAIRWATPATIMEWLKTDPIPKLSKEDIEKLGIQEFNLD